MKADVVVLKPADVAEAMRESGMLTITVQTKGMWLVRARCELGIAIVKLGAAIIPIQCRVKNVEPRPEQSG